MRGPRLRRLCAVRRPLEGSPPVSVGPVRHRLVDRQTGGMSPRIVDVWMQHTTLLYSNHEMFDSLRGWMGVEGTVEEALPLQLTIAAMDHGGVDIGLTAAWYGPEGSLIDNDEVADFVAYYPARLRGVAGSDLRKPMGAVRDLRRRVEEGFVALRIVPWLSAGTHRPPLLPALCRVRGSRRPVLHPGRATPDRSARLRSGVQSPTSTRWLWTSLSLRSCAATSVTPGPPR